MIRGVPLYKSTLAWGVRYYVPREGTLVLSVSQSSKPGDTAHEQLTTSKSLIICDGISRPLRSDTIRLHSNTKTTEKAGGSVRTYDAAKVTTAPQVGSKIKDLEISRLSLVNEGTPEAALAIEVTNHRNEAVMALDFIAEGPTYSGLRMDGLLKADDPLVIIPPHSIKTFSWSLGSIIEGQTINLAAAVFADGKEEGDKQFLEGMKRARADFKNKRAEKPKKGGQP